MPDVVCASPAWQCVLCCAGGGQLLYWVVMTCRVVASYRTAAIELQKRRHFNRVGSTHVLHLLSISAAHGDQ